MTTHQTHLNDEKGQTDSSHKLNRLRLPDDLSGKVVLDIGCNEGFFCDQALRRGAERVVGIDGSEHFLSEARRRYACDRLELYHQSWSDLPEGPFDLILWTSAMHYELDPQSVLSNIATRLSSDGTLVLECGILSIPRKEMVYSIRHDGGLWYPTQPLIEDMLTRASLSYRMVSMAELVGTDPIPRVVYHCRPRSTTVMLISGGTGTGKSSLSNMLFASATKVISLDYLVSRIWKAKWAHSRLEHYITDNLKPDSLGELYDSIDADGLTEDYVKLISKGIAASDELVIIEGYMTEIQIAAFKDILKDRHIVWGANRV